MALQTTPEGKRQFTWKPALAYRQHRSWGAWAATVGAAGGVAVVYFLAARLALVLCPQPAHMAVFWPATSFAAAVLLVAGRRAALATGIGVIAGSIAAVIGRGLLVSTLLGVCNFGEVALFAGLLSWWLDGSFAFRDVRSVVTFLAAAFLVAAISGLAGAALSTWSTRPYVPAWLAWFSAHVVGAVGLLVAELDHRVKNVLACVAAVAQRSRECSRSADEFLSVLNSRINSLANTHALLSRSHCGKG